MSVATHSPLLGSKRLFGEDCSNVVEHRALDDPWGAAAAAAAAAGFAQQHHHQHLQQPQKKVRRCSAVPASQGGVERCAPSASPSCASALRYLSGLYPRMDQKVGYAATGARRIRPPFPVLCKLHFQFLPNPAPACLPPTGNFHCA